MQSHSLKMKSFLFKSRLNMTDDIIFNKEGVECPIRWGEYLGYPNTTNFIFNDKKAFDFYGKWGDIENTLIFDAGYHIDRQDAVVFVDSLDDEEMAEFKREAIEAGLWSEEEMEEARNGAGDLYLPSVYVHDEKLEELGYGEEI